MPQHQLGRLTVLHHHLQELDDDLGARSYEHLPLPPLLCVVHRLQSIVQDADQHHVAWPPASFRVAMRSLSG